MPNEGPTIVDTIEAFLKVDYPAPIQIILAYNTPHNMPIEKELQQISERDLALYRIGSVIAHPKRKM
ncbi:MAG: hypothetical protein IPJ47_10640 [Anaerolineales bacterium]|nr:hypothetical protein [Anaerolineales bacterium]